MSRIRINTTLPDIPTVRVTGKFLSRVHLSVALASSHSFTPLSVHPHLSFGDSTSGYTLLRNYEVDEANENKADNPKGWNPFPNGSHPQGNLQGYGLGDWNRGSCLHRESGGRLAFHEVEK